MIIRCLQNVREPLKTPVLRKCDSGRPTEGVRRQRVAFYERDTPIIDVYELRNCMGEPRVAWLLLAVGNVVNHVEIGLWRGLHR